jgi:hypothetical protein
MNNAEIEAKLKDVKNSLVALAATVNEIEGAFKGRMTDPDSLPMDPTEHKSGRKDDHPDPVEVPSTEDNLTKYEWYAEGLTGAAFVNVTVNRKAVKELVLRIGDVWRMINKDRVVGRGPWDGGACIRVMIGAEKRYIPVPGRTLPPRMGALPDHLTLMVEDGEGEMTFELRLNVAWPNQERLKGILFVEKVPR